MRLVGPPDGYGRFIPPTETSGARLYLELEELGPIVAGSQLPRRPEERPLSGISFEQAMVLGSLADRLTDVRHEIDYSRGTASWVWEQKEYRIPVLKGYSVRFIAQMGDWASRAMYQFIEDENAAELARPVAYETHPSPVAIRPLAYNDLPSVNAAWVAREFGMMLENKDSGVENLGSIHILPADSRFRPLALQ